MLMRVMDRCLAAQRATKLSWTGIAWVLLALGTVVGALLTLGVAAEDVVDHDGLAIEDPGGLSWFIHHRGAIPVGVARVVSTIGSPVALAVLVVAAAVLFWWRGQALVVAVAPALALGAAGLTATLAKSVFG